MTLHYVRLIRFAHVFQSMTGLQVSEFEQLVDDLRPAYGKAQHKRLSRPRRQRAIGGGRHYELSFENPLLLTIIWLRWYPTHETLGYLFEVSDSTARRAILSLVPLLERSGRDTLRMPEPGKRQRRDLAALLKALPELRVVIDSFEQRVPRPTEQADADSYDSGKKKQPTLKSQVAVNAHTGEFVDICVSVRGPTADIKLLQQSALMRRLPEGSGGMADLAYVGIDKLEPERVGAAPRRKPRAPPRPPDDIAYNTAFARRRIVVEHSLNRLRRDQSLSQTDRNHRHHHAERVVSIAALLNRQIRHRCLR